MNRTRATALVLAWLAILTAAPEPSPADGGARETLAWRHWGLQLQLAGVQRSGVDLELTLCFELKSGIYAASLSMGRPRCLVASTWVDAGVRGKPLAGERFRLSRDDSTTRSCFTVIVPSNASELRLVLDDDVLDLELQPTLERLLSGVADAVTPSPAPAGSPGAPVRLEAVLRWEGDKPFVDGALSASETGVIWVDVTNRGLRPASGVEISVESSDPAKTEILLPPAFARIDPGQTRRAGITVRATAGLDEGLLLLTLHVREPHGHDARPIRVEVPTRSRFLPELTLLDDFALEAEALPVPRDAVVSIRLRARNVGPGAASAVVASIEPGPDVFRAAESSESFELGRLEPGEVAEMVYGCYANQRADSLRLNVSLEDTSSGTSSISTLVLPLEDSTATARIIRVRADPQPRSQLSPAPPALTSEIDRNVAVGRTRRPSALGVVLGVERYDDAPSASYAADDARSAARYFERTLGIPPERIQLLVDRQVTLAQFERIFGIDGWLARRALPETEIFVFYAGHGVTGVETDSTFLVPQDADLDYLHATGYSLEHLVQRVASLEAARTTLFLDACFSGRTRGGASLLERARPLVLVPTRSAVPGVSIFSAATGTQLANVLEDQGHGLFTYELFRGLGGAADGDGDGNVTEGELSEHLKREVPRAASRLDREQHPVTVVQDPDRVLTSFADSRDAGDD